MLNWLASNGYNLLLSLGGISVILLMVLRRRVYRLSVWQSVIFGFALMFCAIVGCKLLYIIENRGDASGMSLFGAVFLVLICMPLIGRLFSLKGNEALDACAPCGASVIGFVRFGCYITGCCGGIYTSIGTQVFQWPTQLMESLCDFCILGFLLQKEKKPHHSGSLYAWFLILYCLSRFLIEFLRNTSRDWFALSHGHWFSIIGFILGINILIRSYFHKGETHERKEKN